MGPPNLTVTPPSAIQKQGALGIVASSGIVEKVNGGQDWEAHQFWTTEIDGVSLIEVYVRWEEPAESSGPWQSLVCKQTRVAVTPASVKDISRLYLLVDIYGGTVRELAPVTPDKRPESQWDGPLPVWAPMDSSAPVQVYDFKSGSMVKDGATGDFQVQEDLCGPGQHDAGYDPVHFLARAYSVRGDDGTRTMFPPIYNPAIYTPAPTPDRETALDILKKSGLVEAVNEEQSWQAVLFMGHVTEHHLVGINVQWEDAVRTDGPFRHVACGGTKVLEHPVPWSNVTALLVQIDTELRQVFSLDPDSPPRTEGLTWDEERQRAPRLLLKENGSRLDGKSSTDEIVTVYDRKDWGVLYNGSRQNMPRNLLECPPGYKEYRD